MSPVAEFINITCLRLAEEAAGVHSTPHRETAPVLDRSMSRKKHTLASLSALVFP